MQENLHVTETESFCLVTFVQVEAGFVCMPMGQQRPGTWTLLEFTTFRVQTCSDFV